MGTILGPLFAHYRSTAHLVQAAYPGGLLMNQFVTNTGGGHFACPRGVAAGDWIGLELLEA
jgi:hypothetical protein